MPDRGYFDWVDDFCQKNPQYIELSRRSVVEWMHASGMEKPVNTECNDHPTIDDNSVSRVINIVAPRMRRSFVVPELRSNLLAEGRKKQVTTFSANHFKKTAIVIMGDPSKEFTKMVHDKILKQKVIAAERIKKKNLSKQKDEERRKAAREARLAKRKSKADDEDKEEAKEEEVAAAEPDAAMVEEKPVELSEEEKASSFRKTKLPDMTAKALTKAYASFSLPEKTEGFDTIKYDWAQAPACAEFLRKYLLEQKVSQLAEDLTPSVWFKDLLTEWQKTIGDWRKKASEWKDPKKREALIQKLKEASKVEGEEAKELPSVSLNDVKIDSIENVNDIGSGEPLYSEFGYEDWALLSARYELHLLIHAFKKDLNDADRPSFNVTHMPYYYEKYFNKAFSVAFFGKETFEEFVALIKEAVQLNEKGFFVALLPEDTSVQAFVKFTEEHRRDRVRRADAGDETAVLKFKRSKDKGKGEGKGKDREGKGKDREAKGKGKGKNKDREDRPHREDRESHREEKGSRKGSSKSSGKGKKGKGKEEKGTWVFQEKPERHEKRRYSPERQHASGGKSKSKGSKRPRY